MRLRTARTFRVIPSFPPNLEPLAEVARNLYWTWNTDAAALFQRIDRTRWESTGHNPVRLLQLLSRAEYERLAHDEGFLHHLGRVHENFQAYLNGPARIEVPGANHQRVIAYFSLEFALTESLPTYSGGLGVLAGDHLKSASDLGLPLVGIGLLYRQGYFRQMLGPDGWQSEEYHDIDEASQPLQPVRDEAGQNVTVAIPFDGREVRARIWRLDVGRVPLLLLDSDVDGNSPADRAIAGRLYGGDVETRIQQEMLLGIGGIRALRALGLRPAVCHMNEGHSALLGVDRIRVLMEETGATFDEAFLPVAAATVFTTHTAVAAGIDLFPPELIRKYLQPYYAAMGLDDKKFIGLGRINPDDDHEPFSMALLGLRMSGCKNGVSRLHGTVSRRLWEGAWPNLPLEQVPIGTITNGVHLPTWVSHGLGEIYDRFLGSEWRGEPTRPETWQPVHEIPDDELWGARQHQREQLVMRAREEHRETMARKGLAAGRPGTGQILDPHALTIGFARRFAGYKRATLLFHDLERLTRIVNNPDRPVQFIFAGKAHPRDEPAKQLIREVVEHSRRPEFADRLVVLENYDLDLARALVQGCDVWLNTPLRPLEASGTSGMKAVANGALHMSVLDGWWAEAYRPGIGWSIGRDRIDDDPEVQDEYDAASLYDLLENEVAPLFYRRDPDGIPRDWVTRMKSSIACLAPVFNTSRMVSDYARGAYAPAAASWYRLRDNNLAGAIELGRWLARVTGSWGSIKICAVEDDGREEAPASAPVSVEVQVHLGTIAHEDVRVDIVHGPAEPDGQIHPEGEAPMTFEHMAEDGICHYRGQFEPGSNGRVGYVVRVLPNHPGLPNPLATGLVHWA
jgi:starch phosphorylase